MHDNVVQIIDVVIIVSRCAKDFERRISNNSRSSVNFTYCTKQVQKRTRDKSEILKTVFTVRQETGTSTRNYGEKQTQY